MKIPEDLTEPASKKRRCWIDSYGNKSEFTLRAEPMNGDLGSLLGPIRRLDGQYADGTSPWALNIGGMVRASSLEKAAEKWAASNNVNWEVVPKEVIV